MLRAIGEITDNGPIGNWHRWSGDGRAKSSFLAHIVNAYSPIRQTGECAGSLF